VNWCPVLASVISFSVILRRHPALGFRGLDVVGFRSTRTTGWPAWLSRARCPSECLKRSPVSHAVNSPNLHNHSAGQKPVDKTFHFQRYRRSGSDPIRRGWFAAVLTRPSSESVVHTPAACGGSFIRRGFRPSDTGRHPQGAEMEPFFSRILASLRGLRRNSECQAFPVHHGGPVSDGLDVGGLRPVVRPTERLQFRPRSSSKLRTRYRLFIHLRHLLLLPFSTYEGKWKSFGCGPNRIFPRT